MPDSDNASEGWTSRDKFAAAMETAVMNEAEVAAYCRERGLFPEQLAEAAAKKAQCNVRGSRGRMISLKHRQQTISLIEQASIFQR